MELRRDPEQADKYKDILENFDERVEHAHQTYDLDKDEHISTFEFEKIHDEL